MLNESELITHFDTVYGFAEALALKSVHEIQIPVCSSLTQLTSIDCLKLMKYELSKWSNPNEKSMEKILIFYLVTDYICCGLSSPEFHTVFHKYLNTETSKIKLLKDIVNIWDSLFKNYKIPNIDFVKNLMVGLERIFIKISTIVPDDHIKFEYNKVINKINHYIKDYEQNILDGHTFSINSMQQLACNKNKVLGIENIVPKTLVKSEMNYSTQSLLQQNKHKREDLKKSIECMTLNNLQQKRNLDLQKHDSEILIDHHIPKKPMLMSSVLLNRSTTSDADSNVIVPHEQKKLNAFQIMMFNAKKQKTKVK